MRGKAGALLLWLTVLAVPTLSATLSDCLSCAWPYTAGVNSAGQCYPTYAGYQANLSSACTGSCEAYGRASDTSPDYKTTISLNVYNFSDGSDGKGVICECWRNVKGGFYQYNSVSQNTCQYGVSDQDQSYLDSLSATHLKNNSILAGMTADTVTSNIGAARIANLNSARASGLTYVNTVFATACSDLPSTATDPTFYGLNPLYGNFSKPGLLDEFEDVTAGISYAGVTNLPDGVNCENYEQHLINNGLAPIQSHLNAIDTGIQVINNGVQNMVQSVSALGQNMSNQLNAVDSTLLQKMNNIGGGSVDLSGVYTAIDNSTSSVNSNTNAGDSALSGHITAAQNNILDSLSNFSSRSSARFDRLDSSGIAISDSLGGISGHIQILNDTLANLDQTTKQEWSQWETLFNQQLNGQNTILDSLYNVAASGNKQISDTITNRLNKLSGDISASLDSSSLRSDSLLIPFLDSSTVAQRESLDSLSSLHSSVNSILDSQVVWQQKSEMETDSFMHGTGLVDSLASSASSGLLSGIDTSTIYNTAQNYIAPSLAQLSTDSEDAVAAVTDATTCTDFPDDPEIVLNLGVTRISIPIPIASQYRQFLTLFKTLITLAASVITATIYLSFIRQAIRINLGITRRGS